MQENPPIGEWFKCSEADDRGLEGIEVKFGRDGLIYMRDSRAHGRGPVLNWLPEMFEAFVRGVRHGEFDRPAASMFDAPAIKHP